VGAKRLFFPSFTKYIIDIFYATTYESTYSVSYMSSENNTTGPIELRDNSDKEMSGSQGEETTKQNASSSEGAQFP